MLPDSPLDFWPRSLMLGLSFASSMMQAAHQLTYVGREQAALYAGPSRRCFTSIELAVKREKTLIKI